MTSVSPHVMYRLELRVAAGLDPASSSEVRIEWDGGSLSLAVGSDRWAAADLSAQECLISLSAGGNDLRNYHLRLDRVPSSIVLGPLVLEVRAAPLVTRGGEPSESRGDAPIQGSDPQPSSPPARVSVRFFGGNPEEVAFVRVVQRGRAVRSFLLPSGGSEEQSVEPGPVLVEARLPSGETIHLDATASEVPTEVAIHRPATAHEWLGWQQYLRGGLPPEKPSTSFREVSGGFFLSGPRIRTIHKEADAIEVELEPFPRAVTYSLLGEAEKSEKRLAPFGPVRRNWLMAAPGHWEQGRTSVRLLVGLVRSTERGWEPTATVTVRDPVLAALGFVESGDLPSARLASEALVHQAIEALEEKRRNPQLAAAAAYVLLRLRRFESVSAWFNNLMDWFPDLPDGAVVAGWKAWLVDHDEDRARFALLQAAVRGLPLYTTGAFLLVEGLTALHPEWEGLPRWRHLLRFADPSSLFTSLRLPSTPDPAPLDVPGLHLDVRPGRHWPWLADSVAFLDPDPNQPPRFL